MKVVNSRESHEQCFLVYREILTYSITLRLNLLNMRGKQRDTNLLPVSTYYCL